MLPPRRRSPILGIIVCSMATGAVLALWLAAPLLRPLMCG
jgi:flagellar biosynthesis/type III secretory pathway M-ring protein FliF/YscJ